MSLFNCRRTVTSREKLNVIYAIFGSLHDFGLRVRSPSVVAREQGLKIQTVFSILKNLKIDNNAIRVASRAKRPDKCRKIIFSESFENALVSKQ